MPAESVRVESSDFEFALNHLTPSNRRHVSQYDLISLQKPQSLLYDCQYNDLRINLINPILKRNLISDASGKITWQTLEPLIIKVVYDVKVHPESLVWRFICGVGDGLDGFTVHPIDLKVLSQEGNGLSSSLWKGLNDARVKGGAFSVLFKGFDSLLKEDKKIFKLSIIGFMKTLMPGEPVILLFTSNNSKPGKTNSLIKTFELDSPNESQCSSYFNFVLRSLYRLISSEKRLLVKEDEFIETVCKLDTSVPNVLELEKWRMCIGDEVRNDPDSFLIKHFKRDIQAQEGNDYGETVNFSKQDQEEKDQNLDESSEEAPEDILFK